MINLPDINVWIALAWDGHIFHSAAEAWFNGIDSGGASFCRVTQMGFLRLLTQPKVMGVEVLDNAKAWGAFHAFAADPRVTFSGEAISPEADWVQFTKGRSTKIWTDAYLAAFAIAHNLHVVSFDSEFNTFPKLSKTVLSI